MKNKACYSCISRFIPTTNRNKVSAPIKSHLTFILFYMRIFRMLSHMNSELLLENLPIHNHNKSKKCLSKLKWKSIFWIYKVNSIISLHHLSCVKKYKYSSQIQCYCSFCVWFSSSSRSHRTTTNRSNKRKKKKQWLILSKMFVNCLL